MRYREWVMVIGMVLGAFGMSAQAQNLVQNGTFDSGLANWTVWEAPGSGPSHPFWTDVWLHTSDCDIWVPATCPHGGAGVSYSQKKGAGSGNAHGGVYQVLTVVPGATYHVAGDWSGGVTGNAADNATWWEVVVYDGAVDASVIDQAPGGDDALIAKKDVAGLAHGGVFQFDWEPFSGTFTANSGTVTLALKAGSYYTLDAAAYHDNLSVTRLPPQGAVTVPAMQPLTLLLLALGVGAVGWTIRRR